MTPWLAVGGDLAPHFQTARAQLDELTAAGITHIVDLRSEWTDEALVSEWAPAVRYLHHPVDDAGQVIGTQWFADLVEWVDGALAEPDAKVLVHCHMGVNRAPSAALALLLHQGMDLRAALDAIRAARPIAVIDYARDALDWHLVSSGADARARRNARRRLGRWRGSHHLDPAMVIRAIRDTETPPHRWLLRLEVAYANLLGELVAAPGDVAIGVPVEADAPELSQLDEVLFATADGIVGRAVVVGPVRPTPDGPVLPLLIQQLFAPVAVNLPRRLAAWLRGAGPNLRQLPDKQFARITLVRGRPGDA